MSARQDPALDTTRGFTLLEVLASAMIFAMVVTVLIGTSSNAVHRVGLSASRLEASLIAEEELALLESFLNTQRTPPQDKEETRDRFEIRVYSEPAIDDFGGGAIDVLRAAGTLPGLRKVRPPAAWQAFSNSRPQESINSCDATRSESNGSRAPSRKPFAEPPTPSIGRERERLFPSSSRPVSRAKVMRSTTGDEGDEGDVPSELGPRRSASPASMSGTHPQRGFTLIEVIGAFFMMAVILSFVTGIFIENGRQRSAAVELCGSHDLGGGARPHRAGSRRERSISPVPMPDPRAIIPGDSWRIATVRRAPLSCVSRPRMSHAATSGSTPRPGSISRISSPRTKRTKTATQKDRATRSGGGDRRGRPAKPRHRGIPIAEDPAFRTSRRGPRRIRRAASSIPKARVVDDWDSAFSSGRMRRSRWAWRSISCSIGLPVKARPIPVHFSFLDDCTNASSRSLCIDRSTSTY